MQLRKSERSKAEIQIALQGPSGSGKTMSALLLAQGLARVGCVTIYLERKNQHFLITT